MKLFYITEKSFVTVSVAATLKNPENLLTLLFLEQNKIIARLSKQK